MTPDERTDATLRELLARRPRPSLPADLAVGVLRRLAEAERSAQPRDVARARGGARVVMAVYWLCAAVACASVLARLPLPSWAVPALWGLAVLAVPVGFAVTLWPESARAWLSAGLRPLAPPLEH